MTSRFSIFRLSRRFGKATTPQGNPYGCIYLMQYVLRSAALETQFAVWISGAGFFNFQLRSNNYS